MMVDDWWDDFQKEQNITGKCPPIRTERKAASREADVEFRRASHNLNWLRQGQMSLLSDVLISKAADGL